MEGTPRKPFTLAVAGLVHLMAEGRFGAKRSVVAGAKTHLVGYIDRVAKRTADPDELPERHGRFSSEQINQYTWPLAQAGVFFCELRLRGAYREESSMALRKIVRLLAVNSDRLNTGKFEVLFDRGELRAQSVRHRRSSRLVLRKQFFPVARHSAVEHGNPMRGHDLTTDLSQRTDESVDSVGRLPGSSRKLWDRVEGAIHQGVTID